ncbi:ABC transporter [Beauveria bassiana ARSEF 2860]|uniref:ABC transporter n=1 Tax=Beauveria bassiana (strain ARSEF 2860) TaxID=655819 RepID=J5JRT8_BEAB2|nr:ABC transporter [Beauveria bassiana ARSEF 2860]EJP67663.1 ABC transporter [Beauveria bassiana ARSEF 2860]
MTFRPCRRDAELASSKKQTEHAAALDPSNSSAAGVLYQEYRRAFKALVLFGLHLVLSLVVDSAKSRAYLWQPDTRAVGYVAVISAAARLLLLVVNELPGTAALVDGDLRKPTRRVSSSGFWGRALFLWLNSTLLLGFRTHSTVDDIDKLPAELSLEMLSHHLKMYWRDAENDPKRSLAIVFSRTLKQPLLAVALPRASQHMSSHLMIRVQGILIAEVLDKSRKCKARETAALTLMSKDVEDVVSRNFHDECFRDNLLRTLSDQSPTRVRNSETWRNCLPWRPQRLYVAGFIIDLVGRWTFAAWLVPVFLMSFGESVPDNFIRVWVSAAPEDLTYFAGYVVLPVIGAVAGLLLYYFLQTSRQVRCIQLAAKTPLYKHSDETASGLRHLRAMGLQSGNFLVGLAIWMFSQKTVLVERGS